MSNWRVFRRARQEAVQLIGETLAIGLAERRRAARLHAAAAQPVQEIAHRPRCALAS